MEEKIILVDTNDNAIGEVEKLEAHKKPLLHRAFSVFIYKDGKLLIQKRNKNKYHSGGLWANSVCSHPRANETFDKSVQNRVKFELGLDKVDYTEIFKFTYLTKFSDELFEYEFDHVLLCKDFEGKFNPNKEEIEKVKWVSLSFLEKDLIDNPQNYASWFVICAPKVIEYIKGI